MKWLGAFLLLVACAAPAGGQTKAGIVGQDDIPDYISVVTDPYTGCQYFVTAGGHALTPRLDKGGLRALGCRG